MFQPILNLLWLIILFFGIWIIGMYIHELFHGLACVIQGAKFSIHIWFYKLKIGKHTIKIPSMLCTINGPIKNVALFYYLGGIGAGILLLLLSLVFYYVYVPLFIVLFLSGITNFFYGIYEGLLINKIPQDTYMKWHYVLYIVCIVIGMFGLRNIIINYIW